MVKYKDFKRMVKIAKNIGSILITISVILNTVQPANAALVFTSDVFQNEAEVFRIGETSDATDGTTDLRLEFGGMNPQTLYWDASSERFEMSNDLSLGYNQLKNVVIDNLDTPPAFPIKGQMYYDISNDNTYIYNGAGWEDITISGGTANLDDVYDNDSDKKLDIDNLNGLELESTTSGNLIFDLQNTGNIEIQDAGSTFAKFTDTGEMQIDNLQLDGNTISSTNLNGNVTLDPDGMGQVNVQSNLDMWQNQMKNAVIENLPSPPLSPVVGQVYYNTTDQQTYMYAATGWEPMGYHAMTHINGEDDIPSVTDTTKGLMEPYMFEDLYSLVGQSDEINRNTVNVQLTLGENVVGGVAYLTYMNPNDTFFIANIESVEYNINNNTSPGIALTGGTNTNPVLNYVYVRENAGTAYVEASTTDPHTQTFNYVPIAEVWLGSVGPTSAKYYYIENLTNYIRNFIGDVNRRLRLTKVIWLNGIDLSTAGLEVSTTSGQVIHIHEIVNYPAKNTAGTDTMYDMFYNVYGQLDNTNYDNGTGGNTAIGNSKYHKTFIWGDIYGGLHMERQRKPLNNEYTSLEAAEEDLDGAAVYGIPSAYAYVGFPIAHVIMKQGTASVAKVIDLRSSGASGGGGAISHTQNTDTGTTNNAFTLDSDNSGGDVTLRYGQTNNETLVWDGTNLRFNLSDDLRTEGNLAVVGQGYIADNHTVTDSNGTLNLGRNNGSSWENIAWNDASDIFTISDDLQLQTQGSLRFADADSSNYVALRASSTVIGNVTWTLPVADGTSGQVLSTNGSGALSWTTVSGGSGGSDGWHGSTTRIKLTPFDFSMSDDADDNMTIDNNGAVIFSRSATTQTTATINIPVGYRATHVMVYGSDATNAITVYANNISDSTTATSLGTGTVGTEINITDLDSTTTNYLSIYINIGNNDSLYGGYVTIAQIP